MVQALQERRNAASKEIGKAMAAKDQAAADALKAEVAKLKDELQAGEAKERELDEALKHALSVLPNIPLDDVPVGARTRPTMSKCGRLAKARSSDSSRRSISNSAKRSA
jgi:seryl-tRNA synthetase